MKLGAYYWDGWFAKLSHWTDRLLNDFSEREPVWGWLGATVENMELQIDYAADAGLSFFAFDWYYPQNGEINPMNYAVDRFLEAKNSDRMEFCLLVANHDGGFIFRENWEDACERFMPYLTHPNAMKHEGKPIIIFFLTWEFQACLGGFEEAKKCHDYLNQKLIDAGYPGVFVLGCVSPPRTEDQGVSEDAEVYKKELDVFGLGWIDGITGYNFHRGGLKPESEMTASDADYIYPFTSLARDHEVTAELYCRHVSLPYMPLVIGGWDCRPWEQIDGGARSCYSPDKTPTSVYRHVVNMGKIMKKYPDKMVSDYAIVYAWNENGEGGFIEPTKGDGGAILAAVARGIKKVNE